VMGMTSGCGVSHQGGMTGYEHVNQTIDSALFAAAIESARAEDNTLLLVDPRPLIGQPRVKSADSVLAANRDLVLKREALEELIPFAVAFPDSSHLASVPDVIIANRRVVLERLGVAQADALKRGRCPGALVPPPPPGYPPLDRSGCPKEERRVVITSEPRSGGAYWPGQIDEREVGRKRGQWSLRITARHEGPTSIMTTVDDYVLGRDASGNWQVLKKVNILILE
jgi:hypothetical protein